jgi:hypothetical protein
MPIRCANEASVLARTRSEDVYLNPVTEDFSEQMLTFLGKSAWRSCSSLFAKYCKRPPFCLTVNLREKLQLR